MMMATVSFAFFFKQGVLFAEGIDFKDGYDEKNVTKTHNFNA